MHVVVRCCSCRNRTSTHDCMTNRAGLPEKSANAFCSPDCHTFHIIQLHRHDEHNWGTIRLLDLGSTPRSQHNFQVEQPLSGLDLHQLRLCNKSSCPFHLQCSTL